MANVVVYTMAYCPFCMWAKKMLGDLEVEFTEIPVDSDRQSHDEMLSKSNGQTSVPQIFIDDFHVGGYTDMVELDRQGKLDPLLSNTADN